MATTFEAISRDPAALEDAIAESPSTLAVGTESLRVAQPLLSDLTTLGHALTPATAQLERTLPVLNPAIEAGTDHPDPDTGVQRGPPAAVHRGPAPRRRADDQPGAQRAHRDRRHAQPDGPLPRALPDRLRRLELLVDLPRRPPVPAHQVRVRPARPAEPRRRRPEAVSASRARPRRSTGPRAATARR